MITLRVVFSAAVLALVGCGASLPPAPATPTPSAPSSAAAAPAAPEVLAGGGAFRVDDEPAPGQRNVAAGSDGGSGPTQATVVAETKRVRDLVRGCIHEAGALRTGRVIITIEPSGRPSRVVVGGHLKGTPEGGCVATGFRAAFHVAPFVGAPVTVKMSISIP